jgi:hypothetical protein
MIKKYFRNTFTHIWKRRTNCLCDIDQSKYIKESLKQETMQFTASTGLIPAALLGLQTSISNATMNKGLQVGITRHQPLWEQRIHYTNILSTINEYSRVVRYSLITYQLLSPMPLSLVTKVPVFNWNKTEEVNLKYWKKWQSRILQLKATNWVAAWVYKCIN